MTTRARYVVLALVAILFAGVGGAAYGVTSDPRPAIIPNQVIALEQWKLTTDQNVQIDPNPLLTYTDSNFYVRASVVFRAYGNGVAVTGSKYPRTELREMNKDGTPAAWSTTSGTHTMELYQRVTHLPAQKPEVVIGQIHNSTYQLLTVLTGKVLTLRFQDNLVAATLDTNYLLSRWMSLKVVAGGGYIDVYYNGNLALHQAASLTGCYFKAGAYIQSTEADYAEVEISKLVVTHQ